MCYHVTKTSKEKIIAEKFKVSQSSVSDELKNQTLFHTTGFDHPLLPVISSENPGQINYYRWGLVPSWAKNDADFRPKTLNAVCETIFEKPSYKSAIKSKRCAVIIDGFFEWKHQGKEKVPHLIYLKSREPMALGGVWDSWVNTETGEIEKTFSILTTAANPMMEVIHNSKKRMPFILKDECVNDWISESNPDKLKQMMIPFDEGRLAFHTVSKLVSSASANRNVPEVIKPVEWNNPSLF